MIVEHPIIKRNGQKIATVVILPDNKSKDRVVILLHGGPGGVKEGPENIYVKLSEALAREGIASVRFDFLGAGESDGDYIDMTIANQAKEYHTVLQYVKQNKFGNIGLVGESYGATIALSGLTKDIKALTLLWPAIYLLDNTFAPFVTEERQRELQENGYIVVDDDKVGRAFIEELFEIDNLEDQVRKINIPTILIHGDQDSEVPHHQSEKAYTILQEPKKLIIVPGGDHCLAQPHEQPIVIKEVVSWFKQYL
jgi:uncharacterized protein